MQVYVCIKHVPDTAANINVVAPAGFDESVKFVVNPYDEYGLEEAL
ncbi:MAG: electron transfer flavoprotein subunit beta/FixA family protein, partial [Deltaproteobacteria bacterium]|nr:electron transfer flavoprotein subunit beta/FixA family protein [Deltaproteobacteria bacterium]